MVVRSNGLLEDWELALPDALHAIRTLLCTTTNDTPVLMKGYFLSKGNRPIAQLSHHG